jgi:tol-pal system protein YbgF
MMKTRPLLFLPFVILSACASQSDLTYVQGQVSQLKEESQVIKTQSAGSYSEITQYREEVAALQGGINEFRHDYNASRRRYDVEDSLLVRKSDDIERRLARIEQYLSIEDTSKPLPTNVVGLPPGKDGKSTAPADTAATAKGKPVPVAAGAKGAVPAKSESPAVGEALLKGGVAKLGKSDYAGARTDFSSFMKQNPKSPQVADAQYYIADSYFNEKSYEKAILEYQVVIAKYTKSAKRPSALYKQGLAFEKIGDDVNAKQRFKDVVTVYPVSPEAKLAKKRLK